MAEETEGLLDKVAEHASVGEYSDDSPPLGSYSALAGVYGAGLSGALLLAHRSGRHLPERVEAFDLLLLGTATYRLSRLITKDKITSFLRAPFTEYVEPGAPGEVNERPRGTGVRRSVGELLGCAFCLAQWVSTGFLCGLVFAPRPTRFVASIFTVKAVADFLQFAYTAAESKAE